MLPRYHQLIPTKTLSYQLLPKKSSLFTDNGGTGIDATYQEMLVVIWSWQHHLQRIHRSIGQICPPKLGTVDGCKIWIRHKFCYGPVDGSHPFHIRPPQNPQKTGCFRYRWKHVGLFFARNCCQLRCLKTTRPTSLNLRWIIQLNRPNRYCCTFTVGQL